MKVTRNGETRNATPEEEAAILAQQAADSQPRPVTVAEVKAECNRRVLDVMVEYTQRNTLAAGMAMITQYGPDPTTWPVEKQTKYNDSIMQWAEIERLRARSDAIEAMNPIPSDYTNDTYW